MSSKTGEQRHRERRDWRTANPGAPRLRNLTPQDADASAGIAAMRHEIEQLRRRADEALELRLVALEHADCFEEDARHHHREAQRLETIANRLLRHAPAAWADQMPPERTEETP